MVEDKVKKIVNSRMHIIILIIFLMCLVTLTGTYAWFTWNSEENTELTMTIGTYADVIFTSGNDINAELTPVFNYYDGEKTTFTIKNINTTGTMIIYRINLNITSIDTELASEQVKYALVKNNELIMQGDLSGVSNGNTIEIYSGSLAPNVTNYEFYLYLDGNEENDISMIGKTIVGSIMVEGSSGTDNKLTTVISDLYNSGTKNILTSENVDYNYVSSSLLMNDRLGGTTTDENIGNIRYYGASPENYIDIGDTYSIDAEVKNWEKYMTGTTYAQSFEFETSEECLEYFDCNTGYEVLGYNSIAECQTDLPVQIIITTNGGTTSVENFCATSTIAKGNPRLYRIVGLFKDIELPDGTKKDMVKIVRDDNIGSYSWDYVSSTTSESDTIATNDWNTATVNTLLNNTYYNAGSTNYYSASTESEIPVDFTNIGLTSSARSKIIETIWNIGGDATYLTSNLSARAMATTISSPVQSYTYERSGTNWQGKIGLIYPSDVLYPKLLANQCGNESSEKAINCFKNNWLNSYASWTMTANTNDSFSVFASAAIAVHSSGIRGEAFINPTFYIDPDLIVKSGDGSKKSPYVIGLE